MTSFEKILKQMAINPPNEEMVELPEIAPITEYITLHPPQNIQEVNKILSQYNLPILCAEDSIPEKLNKLKIIKRNKSFNIDKLIELHNKIEQYKQIEKECDMKEIDLANRQVASLARYNDKSVEELRNMLEELKDSINLTTGPQPIDPRIFEKNIITKYLGFLKEETNGIYLLEKIKQRLNERNELWCKVLYKIFCNKVCKVEEIGVEFNIDRVSLLKVVYSLCSKEIIDYDRLNDSVQFA